MDNSFNPQDILKILEQAKDDKSQIKSYKVSGANSDIEMMKTQIGLVGKVIGCTPHSIFNTLFCAMLMMSVLSLVLFYCGERDTLVILVMPGLLSFIGYLFGFYTASNMKDK